MLFIAKENKVVFVVPSPFVYAFNASGVLQEAGDLSQSTSPYFWLDSGGELRLTGEIGQTMQGDASATNKWRILYTKNNALDTDSGLHPQNLFRLVTKSSWGNVLQQVRVRIVKDNFSSSPHRDESNGILLMSRYMGDGKTLYYAGIRVDGTAVIKKKFEGTYYTLAQQKIFTGTYVQQGTSQQKNLLPHNEWIGVRCTTVTNSDGSVTLTLFMQRENEAKWTKLLTATDTGQYDNTEPITGLNLVGIRTDFMDVEFDDYRIENMSAL